MNSLSAGLTTVILFAAILQPISPSTFADDPVATEGAPELVLSNFVKQAGFFSIFWDDAEGELWLEIEEFDEPFLYVSSLATGLGSNPVGLDRGQFGESRLVRFKRVGRRVFLIQENLKYRASSPDAVERRAVSESFAPSVLWGGELVAATDGRWVTKFTSFLRRDAHDVIGTLKTRDQGAYSLDATRSFVYLPRTKAFPDNTEFEIALTYQTKSPGRLANRVAADGSQFTLRQHHSFVRLPDDAYRPRRFDPRMGCFSIGYADYSAPIDRPLQQRWITRHRLRKRDPDSASSLPVDPIVYYVDPGTPQPVRDALIEGASWWSEAFTGAGFQNSFQVKQLPVDADPMDVRYNVIQWVHRATRGWSYGRSVVDPRTGEIMKGHVTLGSLRIRQDHLLMQNLLPGTPASPQGRECGASVLGVASSWESLTDGPTSINVALARIRQLSAHEVGHTLGFSHNFAASTYGDRASVMDYPAPRVNIIDGQLDLSDAYGVGIGDWDKVVVKYAYSEFPVEDEQHELDQIVKDSVDQNMLYISDADARPAGAAHPMANLWDNGSDPVAALAHEMQVRQIAISTFGKHVLADRQPVARLGVAFVPIYLHHRYQVDATAKLLGGLDYAYRLKNDTDTAIEQISVERQRQALDELLKTVQPQALMIPDRIRSMLPPKIGSSLSDEERLDSLTSPTFDANNAIRTAADMTIANILQPQRCTRLAQDLRPNWGLGPVLEIVIERVWPSGSGDQPDEFAARRVVRRVLVDRLLKLAENPSVSDDARAITTIYVRALAEQTELHVKTMPPSVERAHFELIAADLRRFLQRPHPESVNKRAVKHPPGSPIGLSPHGDGLSR